MEVLWKIADLEDSAESTKMHLFNLLNNGMGAQCKGLHVSNFATLLFRWWISLHLLTTFMQGWCLGSLIYHFRIWTPKACRMTPGKKKKRFSRLFCGGVWGMFCNLLRGLNATSHWCLSLVVHHFSYFGLISKRKSGNEKMRSMFPKLICLGFSFFSPHLACLQHPVYSQHALNAPQEKRPRAVPLEPAWRTQRRSLAQELQRVVGAGGRTKIGNQQWDLPRRGNSQLSPLPWGCCCHPGLSSGGVLPSLLLWGNGDRAKNWTAALFCIFSALFCQSHSSVDNVMGLSKAVKQAELTSLTWMLVLWALGIIYNCTHAAAKYRVFL